MRFPVVLFDLDGTLIDSLEDIGRAANWALAERGFPTHPVAAYARMVGEGVERLAERALPPGHRDADTLARWVALYRAQYARHETEHTRPYAGIPELLDALTARAVPFAVLSNKPDDAAQRLVATLLGRWRFAVVRGARPGVPKKPDPAAARAIATELGIAPGEWAYLGDTDTDIRTARGAGMIAIGVAWGFRPDELVAAGALAVMQTPQELLAQRLIATAERQGQTRRR